MSGGTDADNQERDAGGQPSGSIDLHRCLQTISWQGEPVPS
jgi:hypothetical protein